jgi:myo-inositol 2-dehydrogenase/D-chiro-inositol 1-dehydrogenase
MQAMTPINVGIIGAGYIGGVHAGILARDKRVEIASMYDIDNVRAESLAQSCGARVAASVSEVLAKCDAVYITTPNTKHAELAVEAIRAGKHVFCEKPMTTSVDEAALVRRVADDSDKVFQVGHNRRFAPVYAELRQLLANGNAAHSAHVKMNRGELINPDWVGDPTVTGGFLYETTIHMFDMMRFLFGEVAHLTALGSAHEYGETDDFSVLFGFKSGMHATMCSSADASWLFPFERVEVFCHHRTISTREMEALVISDDLGPISSGDKPEVPTRYTTRSMQDLSKEEKWGYVQEDRAFIDAIVNGTPAPVTADDGYKSVELVDACYRSVATGERVEFSV